MTKSLIKAALLLPILAVSLASGASAGGYGYKYGHGYKPSYGYKSSYGHGYTYGYKHYGHSYGHVKSYGWHKAAPVILVPAEKACATWSYKQNLCLEWH